MAEGLEAEVEQLKAQVARLTKLLAATGQQVMQMQMQLRQQGINDMDTKTRELQGLLPNSGAAVATGAKSSGVPGAEADYVTENDLNEMVVELQGQLTLLDERSVRRILNSRSQSRLVALPNADGEEHPQFPQTIADVQGLSDKALFEHWNHYEMMPSGEQLDDLLDEKDTPEAKEGNRRVMQEIYDSFAKYIGIDPLEYPRKAT